ncbi:MAG: hypothetical protein GY820_38510 [Gammaproteobacteria bacterium]|nr:hypothetical protein [Gammaproteobacteria bacterium]
MQLTSRVEGFKGRCKPTWLNTNQIHNRIDVGITGFFRLIKTIWIFKPYIGFNKKSGKEFHGIIRGGVVYTTETHKGL